MNIVRNPQVSFTSNKIASAPKSMDEIISESIKKVAKKTLVDESKHGAKKPRFISDGTLISDVATKIAKKKSNASEKITEGIARTIGKLSTTDTSKKLVEGLSRFSKPSARMADLASIAITFFYVNNTRKSKKIEEERKLPMMVNNISITVVSSTMAYLIDKASDVFLDKIKGAFYQKKGAEVLGEVVKKAGENNKTIDEKQLKEISKKILQSKEFKSAYGKYAKRVEKTKSLTVFAFTVRFLVTVLMGPVATKIVEFIKNNVISDKKQQ